MLARNIYHSPWSLLPFRVCEVRDEAVYNAARPSLVYPLTPKPFTVHQEFAMLSVPRGYAHSTCDSPTTMPSFTLSVLDKDDPMRALRLVNGVGYMCNVKSGTTSYRRGFSRALAKKQLSHDGYCHACAHSRDRPWINSLPCTTRPCKDYLDPFADVRRNYRISKEKRVARAEWRRSYTSNKTSAEWAVWRKKRTAETAGGAQPESQARVAARIVALDVRVHDANEDVLRARRVEENARRALERASEALYAAEQVYSDVSRCKTAEVNMLRFLANSMVEQEKVDDAVRAMEAEVDAQVAAQRRRLTQLALNSIWKCVD